MAPESRRRPRGVYGQLFHLGILALFIVALGISAGSFALFGCQCERATVRPEEVAAPPEPPPNATLAPPVEPSTK